LQTSLQSLLRIKTIPG